MTTHNALVALLLSGAANFVTDTAKHVLAIVRRRKAAGECECGKGR